MTHSYPCLYLPSCHVKIVYISEVKDDSSDVASSGM